jgi:alginate O-acetyltransferase complex protein AlgI
MIFHSAQFMVFLCVSLALYWSAARVQPLRLAVLFLASVIFYSAWMPLPLLLFVAVAAVMRISVLGIRRSTSERGKKRWVAFAVTVFLLVLGLFKYENLFYATTVDLLALFGVELVYHKLNWLFPLGISFAAFQAIHYVVDVYRGHITEDYGYFRTLLYLLFFPHLIAGPIVRAPHLLARFGEVPTLTPEEGGRAILRIAVGVAKKLLLADLLSVGIVDPVFANPAHYTSAETLVAIVAYTFQIYYDFSAYSDIAIGAAALFGFHFPENFNKPYLSKNLFEFWNRWHMSLSTWLRDYLYFPLGGSKGPRWKTLRNLMIVMVLGGLWHGAGWRFAVWGFVHGIGLWIVRIYWWVLDLDRRQRMPSNVLTAGVGILATFSFVVMSRVFFRATDVTHALTVFARFGERSFGVANVSSVVWIALVVAAALHAVPARAYDLMARTFLWMPAPARALVLTGLVIAIRQVASFETRPYIYFQF